MVNGTTIRLTLAALTLGSGSIMAQTNVNDTGSTNSGFPATSFPANTPVLISPSPQPNSAASANPYIGLTPTYAPQVGPQSIGSPTLTSPLFGTSAITGPAAGPSTSTTPGIPLEGPVSVHPHFLYSFSYATGLQSAPGKAQDTSINTFFPGATFDLGRHWKLDYTPSYTMYSEQGFRSTLSHAVSLVGSASYQDWNFGLTQTYFTADSPLIETGTQTAQEVYDTELSAAYQLNTRTTLQFGASQTIRDTDQFENVKTWSGTVGFNYQFIPQFGMGLSTAAGYDAISTGSSMPFEQVQGTLNFRPGQKFILTLSGGVEEMQFVDPSAKPLLTPTFSAQVEYRLFPNTTLSLVGSRSVTPSYFGNEVQVSTRVGASISQLLSKKWSISMNTGYSTEPLTSIVPGPLPAFFIGTPPRTSLQESEKESSETIGVTLSYAMTTKISFAAYCSENESTSSQNNFNTTSTQIGFSANYQY